MPEKLSTITTKAYPCGEITFSGNYPLKLTVSEPIPAEDISKNEYAWSALLEIPVIILSHSVSTTLGKFTYWLLHRDSVLMSEASEVDKTEFWDLLFHEHDKIHVIGLWDGEHVDDLLSVFTEVGRKLDQNSYEYMSYSDVYALRTRRLSSEELKGTGVGIKTLSKKRYFIDREGNSLILNQFADTIMIEGERRLRLNGGTIYVTNGLSSTIAGLLGISCAYQGSRFYTFSNEVIETWRECLFLPSLDSSALRKSSGVCYPLSVTEKQRRDALRAFKRTDSWRTEPLGELGLSLYDVHRLTLEFVDSKELSEEEPSRLNRSSIGEYPGSLQLTVNGRAHAMKKLSRRMTRKTADRQVELLKDRALEALELGFLTKKVDRIILFGSYIDEHAKSFGDLDVILEISDKNKNEENKPQSLDDATYRDAVNKWETAMDCYDRGIIGYRPPTIDPYAFFLYDYALLDKHMKRSNHTISCHHTPEEAVGLGLKDVVVVYDADAGGAIEPKRISPRELWPDIARQFETGKLKPV